MEFFISLFLYHFSSTRKSQSSNWVEGYNLENLKPEEDDFDYIADKMMRSFDISDNVTITKVCV
jgi:hypothetical protein